MSRQPGIYRTTRGSPKRKPLAQTAIRRPAEHKLGLACPACRGRITVVRDSRPTDDHTLIRRRRACFDCDHAWTTYEVPAEVLAALEEEAAAAAPTNAMHFALGAFIETLRAHGYEVKLGRPARPKDEVQ